MSKLTYEEYCDVVEVCHDLINKAMQSAAHSRNLGIATLSFFEYRKEAAIRKLLEIAGFKDGYPHPTK